MNFGYYRLDESMHEYVIPEELVADYDALEVAIDDAEWESQEWHDLIGTFIKRYDRYRIDTLNDFKVVMGD